MSPAAPATARQNLLSSVKLQSPPDTLCEISSQFSFHEPALTSKHVIRDGQPEKLTYGHEEHLPIPPAGLGHTTLFRTSVVPNVEHRGFPAPADTHIVDALSLEAIFNRNSIPLCPRPYGSPIFMRVLGGDIRGVNDILRRCEGSLWDHDPYGLGILYVSQGFQS